MLNRADNRYRHESLATSTEWALDGRPALRLVALFGAILLALCAIAARLAYVQTQLAEMFAGEFNRETEKWERIPSHDGRIIAADGEVLAEDQQLFGITVHYRWLEEPPDPAWLKAQALAHLDRPQKRDPQAIAHEQARVLEQRSQLWNRLSHSTGLNLDSLVKRRREIQRQVEHIYGLVDERQTARHAKISKVNETVPPASGIWNQAWQALVGALTTPPVREATEPVVIREQLDYHLLIPEVPVETAVEVEAHPELYPGTRVALSSRRVYPQGAIAPHLVGYRTPIDNEDLRARRKQFPHGDPLDYQPGDSLGRAGLERYYERHLRGLRGLRKLTLNRRGEVLQTEEVRAAHYGDDLVLSLSLPLQRDAEQLLDDCLGHEHLDETNGKPLPIPPGGAIVALDVRTGAVLAAASAPRFDLDLFTEHDGAAWKEALDDSRKPLFHRATEMALPPGSVFKVLSAIAFIESGKLDPQREFHCQGYLDDPDRNRCFIFRSFGASHGDINLVDALAQSCNVYFFSAARRIGAAPLYDWASQFGFGRPTGIDLPGERGGNLPRLTTTGLSKQRAPRGDRAAGDAMQLAIGQAKLTTTPLQIARFMAAVGNGGKLVTPKLVDSAGPATIDDRSPADDSSADSSLRPIPELSSRTLEWVRMGLAQVVADRHGTGYKTVRLNEITIAGKTGTAEPGGGKPDHAWFAGYVPAERPKIAFVVVLENAGSGGHAAGPVARKLVQSLLVHGLVDRKQVFAPSAN
jgi:penicillin-binding protein 2